MQELLHIEHHPPLTSLQLKIPNAMNADMLDQLNPKSQNYSKDMQALQIEEQELYHITVGDSYLS